MSKWSEQILREAEMEALFNNGYSYAYERKKIEERMWQEYEKEQEEAPVFILQDGTILEGEQLKTA